MSNTTYYTISHEEVMKKNLLQEVEVVKYLEEMTDDGPELVKVVVVEDRPVVNGVVFDPWFHLDEHGNEIPIWIRCSSMEGWFKDYPFVDESR